MVAKLQKIRTKTSEGDWPHPLQFTEEQLATIVAPYHDLVGAHEGLLRKSNSFNANDQWVVRYECETVESGKALYLLLTSSNPVVTAHDALHAAQYMAAGITTEVSWRLTRVP